jgi:NAD(P)-dependent dehydrogenase (short-subunit alcohol dehydrogenase family)
MNRFADRVALITAAGNGLGRGVAFRMAEEGARVVIWDREDGLLTRSQDEAEKQGLSLDTHLLDMTELKAISEAVSVLMAKYGRIDVLVNNIGGSLHTPFHFLDQTDEHWQRVMDINVTACVRTTRTVLPHMLKAGYGRVINMGSKAGRYGSLFAGANYVASKGAMQALTLQIAQEFGPHGITCNSVCPGAIMTERVRGLLSERQTPEERKRILQSIPVRRHGEIEDIAAAIAYLASEEAGFVTGVSLDVNGGQAMSI